MLELPRGTGCRLQGNRKSREEGRHPDRDAQFQNIARLRQEYQAAGDPVISIDTKKPPDASLP